SLTTTLIPEGLGRVAQDRVVNLRGMLDAFFGSTGYHMNVNVLNRDMLLDAMDHPEKYPSLTIRVSGYAVNFVRLTKEQQMDVVTGTCSGGGARSAEGPSPPNSLEAKSPFELRVNQSSGVKESFVKSSIETGDVGFLHSFTTGSAVDGPGVRVVAWTSGCNWRCRYCPNPHPRTLANGAALPPEPAPDEL